jgi:tRNA (cmo5U34)-methyltransferase
MNTPKSVWQTTKLATNYLNGIRGAIPGADLQLAVLRKIAQVWLPAPTRLLDLGCGDGILGRLLLDTFPEVQATFADFSDPMLAAARAKLGENSRATVVKADFSSPEWLNAVSTQVPFDIVVSGFAIHHQPDERKRELFVEIYTLLAPHGIFLNLEHVASQTTAGKQLFDEFFIDQLYDFHHSANPEETRQNVAENFYHRPDKIENILAPLDVQCDWLRTIGFEDVDCFCKVFELALFGGRKPTPNFPNSG